MKQFKRFSLAYAFQVFGVLILFGYPGCSSTIKEQKAEPEQKYMMEKNHAAIETGFSRSPQAHASIFLLDQPGNMQADLYSYLSFSK